MALVLVWLMACTGPTADPATEAPSSAAPEASLTFDALVYVDTPVTWDGGQSEQAARYRWRVGSHDSGWQDSPTFTWTFDAPGRFSLSLQVESLDGRTDSVTEQLVAVYPPLDQAPRAAGDLVHGKDRLFAIMDEVDHIAVVDVASTSLEGHLEACSSPSALGWGDELLVVACPSEDRVMAFDCTSACAPRWTTELATGSRPVAALPADGAVGVVLQGAGELARLDGSTGALQDSTVLGQDPRGLAWSQGSWLVSQYRSESEGARWWLVDEGGVQTMPLADDLGPDSDTDARGRPNLLAEVVVAPDGRRVILGGLKSNIARGGYRDGLPLTHDSMVRSKLKHVGLSSLGASLPEPFFDNRDRITGMSYSTSGDLLFVAHGGTEVIDILDPWTMQRVGGFQDVTGGVTGLAHHDGRVWALASFDGRLLVFADDDLNGAGLAEREVDLMAGLVLPGDELWRRGREVFHRAADPRMSQDAYISCASCHPEGDHDGQTWDTTARGEGLRNTPALYDRSSDQPIHWSANFDEMQDFEHDIREAFGGKGFLSEDDWARTQDTLGLSKAGMSEDLDALAWYVEQLVPRYRAPLPTDPGAVDCGEALFHDEATGCAACHHGPRMTDSAWTEDGPLLHDVGTLTEASGQRLGGGLPGLDTPSLLGLYASAPYLHDGSAMSIREVLTARNPDDAHGQTGHLGEDQLACLEAYLLQLD